MSLLQNVVMKRGGYVWGIYVSRWKLISIVCKHVCLIKPQMPHSVDQFGFLHLKINVFVVLIDICYKKFQVLQAQSNKKLFLNWILCDLAHMIRFYLSINSYSLRPELGIQFWQFEIPFIGC